MTTNEREAFDVLVDAACEAINKIHKVGKKRFKSDMTSVVKAVIDAQARAAFDQRQEVTDEMIANMQAIIVEHPDNEGCYPSFDSIRAVLQSIAQSVKVPDALDPFDSQPEGLNYADGWNACREALLSSSPEDKP